MSLAQSYYWKAVDSSTVTYCGDFWQKSFVFKEIDRFGVENSKIKWLIMEMDVCESTQIFGYNLEMD